MNAAHQREVEEAIDRHLAAPKGKSKSVPDRRVSSAAEQMFKQTVPDSSVVPSKAQIKALAMQARIREKANGSSGSVTFN